jgi:hypothetical protein
MAPGIRDLRRSAHASRLPECEHAHSAIHAIGYSAAFISLYILFL